MNPAVISQSPELEEDRNFLKIAILAVFGLAISFFAVHFFNRFLLTINYSDLWWSVFFGAAFIILTVLQVCFIKSLAKINLIVFLETLAAFAIFYRHFYPQPFAPLILGAVLFLFFSLLGVNHGVKLLENSIRIRFILTAKMIIPKAVTALLILLCAILYLNYFKLGKFDDSKGELLVGRFLFLSKPALNFLVSDFSPDKKVGDVFQLIAETELRKMKTKRIGGAISIYDINFEQLSSEAQKEIVQTVAKELKIVAERAVGPLDSTDTVNQAVFKVAKRYFVNLPTNFKAAFGLIIVFSFFALMKGLAILFYWLLEIIAFLIYKILLASGFAYVTMESRTREFILLK